MTATRAPARTPITPGSRPKENALWQDMGSPDDLDRIWRDTGFYDESGNPRHVPLRPVH